MPVTPIPIPTAPDLPQRNDPATFEARADAYYTWQSGALPDGIDAQANATLTNAQESDQSADDAANARDAAQTARDDAQTARGKAQEWAESPTPPAPGAKSSKSWSQDADGAATSAWAAAAAAGVSAGLPQPLEPGKVLGAISPTAVGWVTGMSEGHAEITTSQSWPVPDDATWVYIEMWGAGASGSAATSGQVPPAGGGMWNSGLFRAEDLPSTVLITIGAGGTAVSSSGGLVSGNDGGDSSFGNLLRAFGGKADGTSGSGHPTTTGGTSNYEAGAGVTLNNTSVGMGNSTKGGGGGRSIPSSGAAITFAGGTSIDGGDAGASYLTVPGVEVAGDGQAPGGAGGSIRISSGTATSGAGGDGLARIYWW